MREIKFRGKRIDTGKWVYGDLFRTHPEHHTKGVSISTDEFRPMGYGSKTWYGVVPETVGQYTGNWDSCGNEVYEGDIIFNDDRKEYGIVKWDEEKAMFITDYTKSKYRFPLCDTLSNLYCSVGNIYQNPDLLK